MIRGNEIVEGLLNYRRRSQASCIYIRVQGNREHGSAGISKDELNELS